MVCFSRFMISLLVLLLLFSCKKNVEPITVNVIIDDTFSSPLPFIEDFPNKIGYKWTYYLMDSANNYFDTLNVEIIGDTTLGNGINYKIWNYSIVDSDSFTRYVQLKDSLAIYYVEPGLGYAGWPYIYVRFPLFVGDSIDFGINPNRTYRVLSYDTIELHNGEKYFAYRIKNTYSFPQSSFVDYFWYVNKIGIVRYKHRSMHGYAPIQELISYDFLNK